MMKLGFGVCAYRDIIWRLLCLFLLFSLMVYPQIKTYGAGQGYRYETEAAKQNEIYSLGNVGYSKINCGITPVFIGKF